MALLLSFNLMNNLLAASAIMRSKIFKFIKLHLWLFFRPNYYPVVHKIFDLMIVLVTIKFFMRSKVKNNASQTFNLMNIFVEATLIMSLKGIISNF